MGLYDKIYLEKAQNILENGYYDTNRTGINTYKLPHQVMQFDLQKEFPILTTKQVAFKASIKELLWIFKDQSNIVNDIKDENGRSIWNEWEMEDGTIGTSYGWIIKEYDQMNKLIHQLKTNPQDRRMMINLWQIPYLDTGALHPCCFNTIWDVTDGRLNCMLVQRSGDTGLGIPFNTTQYAVLVHLLAQVTNLKVGILTHIINNMHIYENQVEGIKEQLKRKDQDYPSPELWINPDVKDFYDFTLDDIKLINYQHHGRINMEVAI